MVGLDTKQVKPWPDVSRRRMLFTGIVGVLGYPFLKNHGTNTDANFSPKLIRPPGSVEESEFLEKCIKCDQCINSCPTNVLQPATWSEGGFESLWNGRSGRARRLRGLLRPQYSVDSAQLDVRRVHVCQ